MTKIIWDEAGKRYFETGIDRGVLYIDGYGSGIAWNGLLSVNDTSTGGDGVGSYLDGVKYLDLSSPTEYQATIQAFHYPPQFEQCQGVQQAAPGFWILDQPKSGFSLCYRTRVGNDTKGQLAAYKLHIIYNCRVAPADKTYSALDDSPDPISFGWTITTLPSPVIGLKPTSHVVVDSRQISVDRLAALEAVLYGSQQALPSLPSLQTLYDWFQTPATSLTSLFDEGNIVDGPDNVLDEGNTSSGAPDQIVDGGYT